MNDSGVLFCYLKCYNTLYEKNRCYTCRDYCFSAG